MGSRRNLDYQKRSFKAAYEEEEDDEEEVEGEEESESKRIRTVRASSSSSKKLGSSTGGPGAGGWVPTARAATCQANNCTANMLEAKQYHRRHKVCEFHAKAPVVLIAGIHQRFCQQCSRFHELSEFDETKRSCRRRLAGHNERRRKSSSSEVHGEGASDREETATTDD